MSTGGLDGWKPSSWRSHPVLQLAEWEDKAKAEKAIQKLSQLPPLVHRTEVDRLRQRLALAGNGLAFVVQGGDCAERFMDCEAGRLETQMKLMMQLGRIVEHVANTPPVVICRLAGQYGKPRSKPTETVEGVGEVKSFKGDNINGFEIADRDWDPDRLVQGYFHSAATLNFVRTFLQEVDPKALLAINADALGSDAGLAQEVKATAGQICGKSGNGFNAEFFTAHEAMQLDLEEALTRQAENGAYYNLSAHMVWIGDRTRQLNSGHVEYFKGIANPIGVKVGPSMKNDELKELVGILNPKKVEGRLVLITRYGAGKIEELLPGHIKAVQESGIPVVWQCDAVHGNGIVAKNGLKTRDAGDILTELLKCIAVHKSCGSVLGGLHIEVTGQESVTECLGGCVGLTEEGLKKNYETYCDPRLNYAQGVEVVYKVSKEIAAEGPSAKKQRTA